MKLSNIDFLRLLPQFMRNDAAVKGLATGLNEIIPGLASAIDKLSTWDHIDELSAAELDELAWELNIPWYDTSANITIKRDVIKSSDQVHRRLGTKWAVEKIVTTYFGEGHITEWWEYGGEPGHFQVNSNNPSINNERLAEFLNLLGKVKRASAKLDAIVISLSGELNVCVGVAIHEIGKEQYAIGATPTNIPDITGTYTVLGVSRLGTSVLT